MQKRTQTLAAKVVVGVGALWGIFEASLFIIGLAGLSDDWNSMLDWATAVRLNAWGPVALLVAGLGSLMWLHFGPQLTASQDHRGLAQEWSRLSDDILRDLEEDATDSNIHWSSRASSPDEWDAQVKAMLKASSKLRARMERRYGARVASAASEMKQFGLLSQDSQGLQILQHGWSTNPLTMKEAAEQIGAAALKLSKATN